jgi:hypothetical protein
LISGQAKALAVFNWNIFLSAAAKHSRNSAILVKRIDSLKRFKQTTLSANIKRKRHNLKLLSKQVPFSEDSCSNE